MQIAENWSRLRGRVESWDPPRKAGDPGTLTIVVDHVDDVAAPDGTRHRNMLPDAAGKTVRVSVPASAAAKIKAKKGAKAVVNVRRAKTPDRYFAHPEHIKLTSK